MEQCIVCLESNADIFSRINTQSSEWKECNIKRIIEKHLWWWYLRTPSNEILQWICRQCWQELSSFHKFYLSVEKVHKQYEQMIHSFGITRSDEKQKMTVKLESGENNNSLFETEDLIPLKRYQKSKKQIEEFNIVEVKREVNTSILDKVNVKDQCGDVKSATKYEINAETTDSLDIVCEPFISTAFQDSDDDDDYHLSDEDRIIIPLIDEAKTKRKRKTKSRKETKISRTKPKLEKVANVEISDSKLAKIIKENDDFLTESQHKLYCSICNAHLADFRILKVHYRNEHNILGYATCCGKKFYKRGLLVDHVHVHKDPEYFKCQPCNKLFATRRGFETHNESHTSRERKFKCQECGKSFFKPDIFERHKLMHMPENEKKFPCNQCGKKFASDYLRRQHEDITHNKKYFKICDICGKSFRENFSFIRHMEGHAGATPSGVACEICGKIITNKYGLRQHIRMRHTAENLQEQICPYCSRVSPNKNAHKLHIKYTHTMERKHACHLCDKSFRRPLELKEHLSTHTGEALYTCPHCPRTFISNANMHKHRKIMHRVEWEESRLKKFNESRKKVVGKNRILDSINNIETIQSCPDSVTNTNVLNF